jgi:hypothetical protein
MRLQTLSVGLCAAVLAMSAPAAARSDDVLACTSMALGNDFPAQIGALMTRDNADSTQTDRVFEQLAKASDACGQRAGMDAEELNAFFDYNMGRIAREWMAVQIETYGISPVVVDNAADLGPGLTNPSMEAGVPDTLIETIVAAVAESGVDTDAMSSEGWAMVGSYLAATSAMWNAHAKLKP